MPNLPRYSKAPIRYSAWSSRANCCVRLFRPRVLVVRQKPRFTRDPRALVWRRTISARNLLPAPGFRKLAHGWRRESMQEQIHDHVGKFLRRDVTLGIVPSVAEVQHA